MLGFLAHISGACCAGICNLTSLACLATYRGCRHGLHEQGDRACGCVGDDVGGQRLQPQLGHGRLGGGLEHVAQEGNQQGTCRRWRTAMDVQIYNVGVRWG
jgi:hypothetical protein